MPKDNEVAVKPKGITDIRSLVESPGFQEKVALQAAKGMDVPRMMGAVWTTIQKTPALLDCNLDSVAQCLKEAALRGLMPDGIMGEAYLIPFKDNKKKTTNCTLMVGVKGYLKMARNSGLVKHITINIVHKDDDFLVKLGDAQDVDHVPNYASPNRKDSDVVACYAIAYLKNGEKEVTVMTRAEIQKIQNGSRGGGTGPWKDHWQEMARKTVLRRNMKYLPLSTDVMEYVNKDMEREEPKRVFDEDDDPATPVRSIEALTEQLEDKVGDGVAVCSQCGKEGSIGPQGFCSVCQEAMDE